MIVDVTHSSSSQAAAPVAVSDTRELQADDVSVSDVLRWPGGRVTVGCEIAACTYVLYVVGGSMYCVYVPYPVWPVVCSASSASSYASSRRGPVELRDALCAPMPCTRRIRQHQHRPARYVDRRIMGCLLALQECGSLPLSRL